MDIKLEVYDEVSLEKEIHGRHELLYLIRDASLALLERRHIDINVDAGKLENYNVVLYWDNSDSYDRIIDIDRGWDAEFRRDAGGREYMRGLYQMLAFYIPMYFYVENTSTYGCIINMCTLDMPYSFVMIAPSRSLWPAVRIILNRNDQDYSPARRNAVNTMAWDLADYHGRRMLVHERLNWAKQLFLNHWSSDPMLGPNTSIVDIRFTATSELVNILYSVFATPVIPVERPGGIVEYTFEEWIQLLLRTMLRIQSSSNYASQRSVRQYLRSL